MQDGPEMLIPTRISSGMMAKFCGKRSSLVEKPEFHVSSTKSSSDGLIGSKTTRKKFSLARKP